MSKRKPAGLPVVGFKWATKVEGQDVDLQCTFNDHGIRCESYGTLSPATNGKGPWYCRRHFGIGGVRVYDEPELDPPTPVAVEIPEAVVPGLRWAHRIKARVAAGDVVPSIAIEKARQALGSSWDRIPGEDG